MAKASQVQAQRTAHSPEAGNALKSLKGRQGSILILAALMAWSMVLAKVGTWDSEDVRCVPAMASTLIFLACCRGGRVAASNQAA